MENKLEPKGVKKLIFIIVIYILIIIALLIISYTTSSTFISDLTTVSNWVLLTVGVFIVGIVIGNVRKKLEKDNDLIAEFIREKNYEDGIKYCLNTIEQSYFNSVVKNAKYNLLVLYLMAEEYNSAFNLLKIKKWGIYESSIIYFKAIECLYNGDLEAANFYYMELSKCKQTYLSMQKDRLARILHSIEKNDFEDKYYLDSEFPIIKKIYDKYANKNKF